MQILALADQHFAQKLASHAPRVAAEERAAERV
jgi:hypothetical protein